MRNRLRTLGSGTLAIGFGGTLPLKAGGQNNRRSYFLNEIEKSPDLCRRQMPGRMIGIERIAFVGPSGQNLHEFSLRERGFEADGQFLKHALAGNACSDSTRVQRSPPPGR